MPKISALPPMVTADAADEAPIVDTSASTTKKWTLTLLKAYLDSFVAPTDILPYDYVVSGCVWTGDAYASTRAASMTAGIVWVNGVRVSVGAVIARLFTASKDTYIDVGSDGVLDYTEVANNATSPALAAGHVRLGIIVTGASNIAAVGSVNQGQENKVLPLVSSVPYSVQDGLGNLICPRDRDRKLLGYRQRITDFTVTAANTQIPELSCPVIIPANRKVKITVFGKLIQHNVAVTNVTLSIWEGTPGSGTQLSGSFTTIPGSNYSSACIAEALRTPDATTKTYNGALGVAATGKIEAAATFPLFIKVELV